jgi:hypothetical protein
MDAAGFPDFEAAKAAAREEISLEDFWSYMPQGNYIFVPARAHWPGSSVDARLPKIKVTDANGQEITWNK